MQTPTQEAFSRRHFLHAGSLGALGLTFTDWMTVSEAVAAAASGTPDLAPLNRFPRMVQEYFVRRVRRVESAGEQARSEWKTRADAEDYLASVRERIQKCFGPWPDKTPLNARVTGKVERDAYHIENIIFESRPGFLVTGNLYVPKNKTFPRPGVIGVCGHSNNGKAAEAYQAFSQGLARMGYVVFIIDPIGQGERSQYVAVEEGQPKDTVPLGVRQHLLAGNQQFLVGEFIGSWRAWDGMRALDYLLTRPEVDARHVGVTGNSGGGTMTTWLCGVESRWTMAAPSCFVTTFRRNMENELPADTEQCPPRALRLGLDHADFIAAMAPKPVVLLAKERDYFDVRGTEEAYARLKRLYTLLGHPENISLFVGPTYHGYSQENREAMYRWFNRVTGVSDAQTEPALMMEPDATLYAAPQGQVALLDSRTVFSFTQEKSRDLTERRPRLEGEALKQAVARTLKLQRREDPPDYRILRQVGGRHYPKNRHTTYAVTTEPGIQAIVYRLDDEVLYSRPPEGNRRAVLYVSHLSSDAELREEPLIRELMEQEKDAVFYTCDARGIGESRPDTTNPDSYFSPYGSDYFYAIHAIMLDRPYVGRRTFDVLRVLDWLEAVGHTEIHLAAKGWGSLPATFAALFSENVKQVTLKNALRSYADLATKEFYEWPLSSLLPGVLRRFDLPDCYAALKTKQLKQTEPWGAMAG